jgi:hypothetical protein
LVAWAQSCLAQLLGPSVPQDGVLGAATQQAVQEFQAQQRLSPSGFLDGDTIAALQAACSGGSAMAPPPDSPPPPAVFSSPPPVSKAPEIPPSGAPAHHPHHHGARPPAPPVAEKAGVQSEFGSERSGLEDRRSSGRWVRGRHSIVLLGL